LSDSTASMKHTMSCSTLFRHPRFANTVAPVLLFLLALLVSVGFMPRRIVAQKRKPPASNTQTTPNASTPQQKSLRKKLTAPRSSDTSEGSRVTIVSDGVLNDYSAYRSGNRFYVVIPEADAPQAASSVRGRGFENVQVQKRGGDAVISFQLQPGTAARVNQKFNKLDVVFSAPGAQPSPISTTSPKTNQKPDQKPDQKIEQTQKPAINQRVNETAQANSASTSQPNIRTASSEARQSVVPVTRNNSATSANVNTEPNRERSLPNNTSALPSLSSGLPTQSQSPTTTNNAPSANASPIVAPPAGEIAQQTQPSTLTPNTTGASNTSATTSSATTNSLGAVVARNLPLALIAVLVLGLLGVVFAMRSRSDGQPAAASTAQQAAIRQNTLDALADGIPPLPESDVAPLAAATTFATVPAATAPAPQREASPFIASSATKEIEPIAPAVDVERAEIETQNVLAGEPYDETVIGARDPGARQIIAAGLLAALAGRNAQKRDNARAVFIKHDYFDEATRDLRTADAPAERVSAARTLGLVRDTAATPHLIAALEDSSHEVRRAAVEALAEVRDSQAVAPLEALRDSEKNRKEKSRKIPRALIQRAIEACVMGQEKVEAPIAAPIAFVPPIVAETSAPFASADETPTIEAAPVNAELQTIASTETPRPPDIIETLTPAVEINDATLESMPPAPPVAAFDHSVIESASESAQPSPVLPAESSFVAEESSATTETFESNFADEAITAAQFAPPLSPQQEIIEPTASASEISPPIAYSSDPLIERHDAPAQGWVEVDMSEPEVVSHAAPAKSFVSESLTEAPSADATAADVTGADAMPEHFAAEPVIETATAFPASSFEERVAPATPETIERARPDVSAKAPTKEIDNVGTDKGIALFGDDLSAVPSAILHRLASEDPSERAAAVEDLARVSGEDSFREIGAAFDDPAQEVSNAAARALFHLNPDRAASFTRALREAPPERRRKIGAALASSGLADDAIGHLMGESREKTYDAFSLLFLMSKAGEVQPLMKAIEEHPNNEVRLAVVKLLALSGQQEILPAFRRLAVRGSLPTEVRSAVMEAIYQISSQSASDASSAA